MARDVRTRHASARLESYRNRYVFQNNLGPPAHKPTFANGLGQRTEALAINRLRLSQLTTLIELNCICLLKFKSPNWELARGFDRQLVIKQYRVEKKEHFWQAREVAQVEFALDWVAWLASQLSLVCTSQHHLDDTLNYGWPTRVCVALHECYRLHSCVFVLVKTRAHFKCESLFDLARFLAWRQNAA